jgi:hypothetical protein
MTPVSKPGRVCQLGTLLHFLGGCLFDGWFGRTEEHSAHVGYAR